MTVLIFILIAILILSFIPKGTISSPKPTKKTDIINYKCQDCGYQFSSTKTSSFCPECKSDLIDDLLTIGLLGYWFGFWGKGSEDPESSFDSFEDDPWNDDFDSFDDY